MSQLLFAPGHSGCSMFAGLLQKQRLLRNLVALRSGTVLQLLPKNVLPNSSLPQSKVSLGQCWRSTTPSVEVCRFTLCEGCMPCRHAVLQLKKNQCLSLSAPGLRLLGARHLDKIAGSHVVHAGPVQLGTRMTPARTTAPSMREHTTAFPAWANQLSSRTRLISSTSIC